MYSCTTHRSCLGRSHTPADARKYMCKETNIDRLVCDCRASGPVFTSACLLLSPAFLFLMVQSGSALTAGVRKHLKSAIKRTILLCAAFVSGVGGGAAWLEAADANRVQLCRSYSHAVWKTNWGLLDLIHHLVQTWRPLALLISLTAPPWHSALAGNWPQL